MNQIKSNSASASKTNLWLDVVLFVAILVALSPSFTGLLIHEWLSIALGGTVIVHLLLHWDWVVATTKRFLGHLAAQSRFFFILNLILFIDFTAVFFTGLMVSRRALPSLGIHIGNAAAFTGVHAVAAFLFIPIMALHVAVHWKWILNTVRRYVWMPLSQWGKPAPVVKPSAGPASASQTIPLIIITEQEVNS